MNIPWPYSIATYVSSTVHGYDEAGRAMRRTIMRYVCLSLTMVFRVLSHRVRARFPKTADLVKAGLLLNSELRIIESLEGKFPKYGKNWLPIVWAANIVNRARAEGRIRDDFAAKTLIKELNLFRSMCGTLINYEAICIPLVYLQVVTIAVYAYFVAALFEHPIKETTMHCSNSTITERFEAQSVYHPIFLMIQFIVYMGWLKAAETMLNPFGDDDDDFEVNVLIDSNIQMSYLIVDEMHNEHPELLKDAYWDEMPKKLNDQYQGDINDSGPTDVITSVSNPLIPNIPSKSSRESDESIAEIAIFSSHEHLIPSASIIDRSYQNKPDIKQEQNFHNFIKPVSSVVKEREKSESDNSESSKLKRREKPKLEVKKHFWFDETTDESKNGSEHEIKRNSKLAIKSESDTTVEKTKSENENENEGEKQEKKE